MTADFLSPAEVHYNSLVDSLNKTVRYYDEGTRYGTLRKIDSGFGVIEGCSYSGKKKHVRIPIADIQAIVL